MARATCTKNLVKFGCISSDASRQTDRRTDIQTIYNTSQP